MLKRETNRCMFTDLYGGLHVSEQKRVPKSVYKDRARLRASLRTYNKRHRNKGIYIDAYFHENEDVTLTRIK